MITKNEKEIRFFWLDKTSRTFQINSFSNHQIEQHPYNLLKGIIIIPFGKRALPNYSFHSVVKDAFLANVLFHQSMEYLKYRNH